MSAPALAALAGVIANPTCAGVLDALMADRSLTVTGLADEIGAARPTVSEAVSRLAAAGLVTRRREGRATRVSLGGREVAEALEALGVLAAEPAPVGLRAVTRREVLREARTCYDHLAGAVGVRLADALVGSEALVPGDGEPWRLTEPGRRRLTALGVDPEQLAPHGRRPLVRACRDWTERRDHVGGRVGAAVCSLWLAEGLARRLPGSRAVQVTAAGEAWLGALGG